QAIDHGIFVPEIFDHALAPEFPPAINNASRERFRTLAGFGRTGPVLVIAVKDQAGQTVLSLPCLTARGERGSSPARCTKAKLSLVTELGGSGAKSLEPSRPQSVTHLPCINNPTTAQKIKGSGIVGARSSVIVMMFPPFFPATLNRTRYCAEMVGQSP